MANVSFVLPDLPSCEHAVRQLRLRTIQGGSKQWARQCLECGDAMGQAVKREVALAEINGGEIVPFDDDLRRRYMENRNRFFEERRSARSEQWWAWYNDYLLSEEWAERRRKVMHRCGGWCEGCADAPAAHVHHLTYDHVGDELLFELVGVCEDCHERAHEERQR